MKISIKSVYKLVVVLVLFALMVPFIGTEEWWLENQCTGDEDGVSLTTFQERNMVGRLFSSGSKNYFIQPHEILFVGAGPVYAWKNDDLSAISLWPISFGYKLAYTHKESGLIDLGIVSKECVVKLTTVLETHGYLKLLQELPRRKLPKYWLGELVND